MRTGRRKRPLELTSQEREKLDMLARRPKTSQRLALRAKIVLGCAEGRTNRDVARYLHVSERTVGKWRERFRVERLKGLCDQPRPGAPRTILDRKVEEVVTRTLETTPKAATHWSTRAMAKEAGISDYSVRRIRRGTFKSVKSLEQAILEYLDTCNEDPKPFVWTATAEEIFGRIYRLCERISHAGH